MTGKLIILLGPMKSGKSSEMYRLVERYHIAKENCLILRPLKDTRNFLTRDHIEEKGSILIKSINDLNQFDYLENENISVIGIDELEMFNDVMPIKAWADVGYTVIVSSLNADSDRKPFGKVYDLIPYADEIKFLTAVCEYCGEDAIFSYADFNKTEQLVAGDGQYKALCRKCYLKQNAGERYV